MVHSFQCSRIRQSCITVDDTISPLVHNIGLVDLFRPFPTYVSHVRASSSHHPSLSSQHFIQFGYPILWSYCLILHLLYSGSPGMPSTSTPTLTISQHLTAMLQLPHDTSLMLLRLSRYTFNHVLTLTINQHLAVILRLQALHSPNTYRMHSRLMRDAGKPDQ